MAQPSTLGIRRWTIAVASVAYTGSSLQPPQFRLVSARVCGAGRRALPIREGRSALVYRQQSGTGPEWEHLRDRIVGTLPIPRDFRGALRFAASEHHDVVLLMVTFLVYAWCVADDLQIVPEDGRVIMETSHHGDVLVHFPEKERLNGFVTEMSECDFPACPEEDTR